MKNIILSTIFCFGVWVLQGQSITFFNIKTEIEINKVASTNTLKQIIGLPEQIEIIKEPYQVFVDKLGMTHSKYNLSYQGIPIEFSTIITHSTCNKIVSVNGEFFEGLDNIPSNIPLLSNQVGLNFALEYINSIRYVWEDNPENYDYLNLLGKEYLKNKPKGELVFCGNYQNKEDTMIHLAYKFNVWSVEPFKKDLIYVDANNGKLLLKTSLINNLDGIAETKYSGVQTISTSFDTNNQKYILKDENRGNGIETYLTQFGQNYFDNDNNWTWDEHIGSNVGFDAHWGAMKFYDYFLQIHNRNSIDNNGAILRSVAQSPNIIANAYWDITTQAVYYGLGGGNYLAMTSLDIVAHEMGHGLIEHTANLIYLNESGALNESICDIWGVCVENFVDTDRHIWTIGEQVYRAGLPPRDLSNPKIGTAMPQPNTYEGEYWWIGNLDNGGVHTNSGIGNYWFYLLSVGGVGSNDNSDSYDIQGVSIENSEQIIYRALTLYFTPNTNYHIARQLTIQAAVDLYGPCSQEVVSTTNAWYAVGIGSKFKHDENLFLTQNIPSYANEVYIAENDIEIISHIEPITNTILIAGNSIRFNDGFKIESGSRLSANIEECNGNINFGKNETATINTLKQKKLDNIKSQELLIYPNPTHQSITIQLGYLVPEDDVHIIVFDLLGNNLLNQKYQDKSFEIDLHNLSEGVYFIQIRNGNNKYMSKIMKL